jgi:hypothetical protein
MNFITGEIFDEFLDPNLLNIESNHLAVFLGGAPIHLRNLSPASRTSSSWFRQKNQQSIKSSTPSTTEGTLGNASPK